MALIKCPECGKEVSDSVRFCDNCGHKFSETVVDVVSEQNEPTQISGEIDTNAKYSLQGTTQGRYLTGGVPPVRFSM